jgi:predicted DNA binding CopG/RHH family protein
MALTEKKKKSDKRYHEKLDKISIQPHKERGAKIRQAAADAGMSLQGYILQAVEEKMERDKR